RRRGWGYRYVFVQANQVWSQQAYVKPSNTGAGDRFGDDVALSLDGHTLAVGARFEDSSATGIDGDPASNASVDSGAAYMFRRANDVWSQEAYIKASNTGNGDTFGGPLALSADGDTLAVASYQEDSAAIGMGGDQADEDALSSGAVYVYTRVNTAWSQRAYVKASNGEADDSFGAAVGLSGDGNTLAVGAYAEDSPSTGIGGDQLSNAAASAGAVYLY
ncbi:MAG: integrin, partial [Nannocystis sp.]